jgi:topoisomerase-4 subunit B
MGNLCQPDGCGRVVFARRPLLTGLPVRDAFGGGKVDITRFKGLGEMQSVHLRETTMDPTKRTHVLRATSTFEVASRVADEVRATM